MFPYDAVHWALLTTVRLASLIFHKTVHEIMSGLYMKCNVAFSQTKVEKMPHVSYKIQFQFSCEAPTPSFNTLKNSSNELYIIVSSQALHSDSKSPESPLPAQPVTVTLRSEFLWRTLEKKNTSFPGIFSASLWVTISNPSVTLAQCKPWQWIKYNAFAASICNV